jgi:asparagine synthase (glutamine-hydrolysing)
VSGFTGILQAGCDPPLAQALARMNAAMKHRGPDGIDSWTGAGVGLGHCKLATTPEASREALPHSDGPGGLTITADARIDNRSELISALGLRGRAVAGMGDGRLILEAYKKWGCDCVHHLVGDFAFLIWDQPRLRLFGARDHMGVKPFYYHRAGHFFAAASEVSALREHPRVPERLDEGRIADFLVGVLEGIDRTSTFFQQIHRLPAAHRLTVGDGRLHIEQYWQPDAHTELTLADDREYGEAFEAVFRTAVGSQLRCDGQVTSMLSGGVDSSTVATVAAELLAQRGEPDLPVYSGVSARAEVQPEMRAMEAVIASAGVAPVRVGVAQLGLLEPQLQALFRQLQEPFDSTMTIIQALYLSARSRGHRVMLDGVEGDLVHSLGTCYPALLLRQGRLLPALRETRLLRSNYHEGEITPWILLRQSLLPALVPDRLREWRAHLFSGRRLAADLEGSAIDPAFASRIDVARRLARFRANAGRGLAANLREEQIRCVTHPLLSAGLERYDRIAASCGMEARHPLLDRRLVEFSVSLPWNQKVRNGCSKYQLRRLAADKLPHSVAWRHSSLDLGWEFTHRRMLALGDSIAATCRTLAPQFAVTVQKNVLERAMSSASRYTIDDDSDMLWQVYSLATWSSTLANNPRSDGARSPA